MPFDEDNQIPSTIAINPENNIGDTQLPIQEENTQQSNPNQDIREQFIYDSTHGPVGDRATWRESETGRFAKSDPQNENSNTYLSFTDEQIEKARTEMNTNLTQKDDTEKDTTKVDSKDKQIQELTVKVADLTKKIDKLIELMIEQNKTYDNPEDLQKALDPDKERPLNPLEQVQATLLPEQIQKQKDFAKAVEEERIAHDPTYRRTPEVTPQETDPNKERKERNWKRAALIAGVVAGGSTGILGGVPAAGIGALACIGAGVINKGVDFIGSKRINKLTEQLKTTTDPETKTKLEKRIKNWEKARKGTEYVKSFLTGAKLGLLASSIFSGAFMGGHGLVWNQAEIPTAIPTGNTDASGTLGSTSTTETAPQVDQPAPSTDGGFSTPEATTETYDIFANGRLNLPGSEMDGWRLADIPAGWENVRLEDIPANQFANEASKYFHMFIRDAGAAGYTNAEVSNAVSSMGPQVAHQIFRDAAYSGQNILQSMIQGGWLPTK